MSRWRAGFRRKTCAGARGACASSSRAREPETDGVHSRQEPWRMAASSNAGRRRDRWGRIGPHAGNAGLGIDAGLQLARDRLSRARQCPGHLVARHARCRWCDRAHPPAALCESGAHSGHNRMHGSDPCASHGMPAATRWRNFRRRSPDRGGLPSRRQRCGGVSRAGRPRSYTNSKCASVGFPVFPLMGRRSCGHADMATTQSISARSRT